MVLIAGSVHSRGHLLGMCMIPWRSEFQQLSELVADTCRPEARSLKRAMQIPIYPHGIAWVSYIYIWYHGIIQYPPAGSVIVIIFKFSHSISSICKCQSIYIQAVSYMVSYANSPMTLSLSLSLFAGAFRRTETYIRLTFAAIHCLGGLAPDVPGAL